MNLNELNAMSDREINRLVAEWVMGWKFDSHSGSWIEERTGYAAAENWNPTEDHNDCAAMRAGIERRGAFSVFMRRLVEVLNIYGPEYTIDDFAEVLTATPRQQCLAALLALEANGNG